VDVIVIGAGLGGLSAAAVLTQRYGKQVAVFEAHSVVGGVAHAFDAGGYTFDAGPTIVLGCSAPPYSPLQQVLAAVGVGEALDWVAYDRWGMIVPPAEAPDSDGRWDLVLGANAFEHGPLARFGGARALEEFSALREALAPLAAGAQIPALAMRSDSWLLLPLLRWPAPLLKLIGAGARATGAFAPYLIGGDGVSAGTRGDYGRGVSDGWLRAWLDALAFSLSGLPAARTPAAAMAAVLGQLHDPSGPTLDYPTGGFGAVAAALRGAVEGTAHASAARGGQPLNGLKRTGSYVRTRARVSRIDVRDGRAVGVTLASGARVRARDGVICNAPVWTLGALLAGDASAAAPVAAAGAAAGAEPVDAEAGSAAGAAPSALPDFVARACAAEMTGSFLHLHLGLDARGLRFAPAGESGDGLRAHYTVMRTGLASADPCGALNMIAVSIPSALDPTLAPAGKMVVHAYAAGNERYELWEGLGGRGTDAYRALKEARALALWEAVERVIPDARTRAEVALVGSPLTHELWNRRPRGTYGAAVESLLPNGATPCERLVLCGDGVFPGIGVPAVALSGASAANALVNPVRHWAELVALDREASAASA
jgi:phytoene dehydrogenase-like protein